MDETEARRALVATCRMLYDRDLTVSAGGNMSVRIDGGILITPSGRNKGLLSPEDLVKVSMDGTVISGGKPSIETGFHLALYRANPGTNAVVHCHPLNCIAITVRGERLRCNLTPEGALLLGRVAEVVAAEENVRTADVAGDRIMAVAAGRRSRGARLAAPPKIICGGHKTLLRYRRRIQAVSRCGKGWSAVGMTSRIELRPGLHLRRREKLWPEVRPEWGTRQVKVRSAMKGNGMEAAGADSVRGSRRVNLPVNDPGGDEPEFTYLFLTAVLSILDGCFFMNCVLK